MKNLGKEKSLVSIIIPCYNQGQFLQEAIDSILASTYKNIEIIVINDGSTENIEFLKTFSAPMTKIIHQENQGLAMARNNGIKAALGEYILPLDADDKIHRSYIEKAINILENNNKVGIVYCEAEFFGARKGKWKLNDYKLPDFLWGNVIFCTAMFKKTDWRHCGGYKKEMLYGFEDWEFWLSLIERGAEVYKIPEVLFFYRQTEKSMIQELTNNNDNRIAMIKQIIKFHSELYVDNLEEVLLTLHKYLELYNSRGCFISKIKYRVRNILRTLLKILNI